MTARRISTLTLGAVLFAAMAAYTWARLEPTTGVTHFLAADSELELAAISKQLADSVLTRTMILSVGAPDDEQAKEAAREWSAVLSGHSEIESLRRGPGENLGEVVFELHPLIEL